MYTPSSSYQSSIFGDGWLYKTILEKAKDNPLVKLRPIADRILKRTDKRLRAYYSDYEGRPSFPCGVLFKMILLEYLYKLSDVAVSKICVHDFLFRWFIGIDVIDPIPDDTTLVKFRGRLKDEGFREIFNELVEEAKKLGYVKGKLRIVDATHIFSDTPKLGLVRLIKQGMRKVIKKVEKRSKELASKLIVRYKESLKRVRKSKERVEEVASKALELVKELGGKVDKEVDMLLMKLERVAKGNPDKLVSFTDPDARWGKKSKDFPFGGYKIHIGCEPNGFVTSAEAMPGNTDEGVKLKEFLEKERRRGLKTEELCADALYDNALNRKYLKRKEIIAYIPSSVPACQADEFKVESDRVKCKGGKYSIGKIRQKEGDLYYFSVRDCRGCKWKGRCISPGEIRKKVYLSDCRRLRRGIQKEKYKLRLAVERVIGQAKRWRELGRAKYRGLWKVEIQALMTFMVGNLKIMTAGP